MANFLAFERQLIYVAQGDSATVVASMITLINDARIAAGKKTVGFINPAVCFSLIDGALKLNNL